MDDLASVSTYYAVSMVKWPRLHALLDLYGCMTFVFLELRFVPSLGNDSIWQLEPKPLFMKAFVCKDCASESRK